jgi:hypothetical protein
MADTINVAIAGFLAGCGVALVLGVVSASIDASNNEALCKKLYPETAQYIQCINAEMSKNIERLNNYG